MTTLYGISNCDTVKKALAWLAENNIAYSFVDFKKTPPDAALIESWLKDIPIETLLNKRGTTWRKLSSEQQAAAECTQGAIAVMLEHPSLIKRPILLHQNRYSAGFQADVYTKIFLSS